MKTNYCFNYEQINYSQNNPLN